MRQLRRRNPRRRELRRWQSRRRQLRRRQRRRDKPRRRQLRREKPRRKQLRRRKLRMRKPRRRQPRRRQLRRDNASKQPASKEEASKEAASKEASSKSIHPRGPRKCRPGRKGPRAEVLGAGLPAGRGSAGQPGHVRRCLAALLPVAEGKFVNTPFWGMCGALLRTSPNRRPRSKQLRRRQPRRRQLRRKKSRRRQLQKRHFSSGPGVQGANADLRVQDEGVEKNIATYPPGQASRE